MPTVVTVPTQAALVAMIVQSLRTAIPAWRADPSDPLYYAVEELARRIILQLTQLNATAASVAWDTAAGTNLDQLIPGFVRRQGESDAAYKARFAAQLQTLSGRTAAYVLNRARATPSQNVSDAGLIRDPSAFRTDVYVQAAGFTRSSRALRTAVKDYLDLVGELYATYNVLPETVVDYTVNGTLTLTTMANPEAVRRSVGAALPAAQVLLRRLGAGVYDTDLIRRIWTEGLADVQLTITRDQKTYTLAKVAQATGISANQFQVRSTSDNKLYRFQPASADAYIDIGVDDVISFSSGSTTVTTGAVSKAVWAVSGTSHYLDVDVASVGTVPSDWTTSASTGWTITVTRQAGDLAGYANAVPVGKVGTTWYVHTVGESRGTAGPLTG